MNLHDIPDRRADPPRLNKWQQAFADVIARGDLPDLAARSAFEDAVRLLAPAPERILPWFGGADMALPNALENPPIGAPTIEALPESQVILRRLNSQWAVLQRARLTARELPMVAFFLTDYEWGVLRAYVVDQGLLGAGFPVQEGVENSYRGYPLKIVHDLW